MYKPIFICFLLIVCNASAGRSQGKRTDTTNIFTVADVLPRFGGGVDIFYAFLSAKLKHPVDKKQNIAVRMLVEKNGTVSYIKMVAGAVGGNNEVLHCIRSMQGWKPASMEGRPIRFWYNLPVILYPKMIADSIIANALVYDYDVNPKPAFKNGIKKLEDFLLSKFKLEKPLVSRRDEAIQDEAIQIELTIEKDCRVSDAVVAPEVSKNYPDLCKYIMLSPKWKPGKIIGHSVRVKHSIKINLH